jgi:diguanylate cyclase
LCPADGNTAALLLQRADAAMFRAKRQHSGHAFFNALTDSAPSEQLSEQLSER